MKLSIPHLLRQKVHYPSVKVLQLPLWQTAFSFRGKVGYPTFLIFFFFFFTIVIHISHVFSRKINILHLVSFRIFSAQKCCQKLRFLFRGKRQYSRCCSILTIFSTILHGILSKMNNLLRDNNSCKTLANIFLFQELRWYFNSVKTLDLIFLEIMILWDNPQLPL